LEFLDQNLREIAKIKEDNSIEIKFNTSKGEEIRYIIERGPFRIYQYINGKLSIIVNHRDTLYFENSLNFRRRDVSASSYLSGDREYDLPEFIEKVT
jgi:hypothetical protein